MFFTCQALRSLLGLGFQILSVAMRSRYLRSPGVHAWVLAWAFKFFPWPCVHVLYVAQAFTPGSSRPTLIASPF
jgi:hypothetical protein